MQLQIETEMLDAIAAVDVALILATATDAIADLEPLDTIVDARSESEYAEDRLPGAHQLPGAGRCRTRRRSAPCTSRSAPFDAKKKGAALVSRNIVSPP